MAKQLLNRPQIRPSFEQMRRKCMSERMRRDLLGECQCTETTRDQSADTTICQSATVSIDEERIALGTEGASLLKIGFERSLGWASERDQAFFSPFTQHSNHPAGEVQLCEVKPYQLSAPHSGSVEELQDRAAARIKQAISINFNEF